MQKLLNLGTENLYQKSKLSTSLFELRNMISTAYLIVEQSRKRVENKGGFYNSDLNWQIKSEYTIFDYAPPYIEDLNKN